MLLIILILAALGLILAGQATLGVAIIVGVLTFLKIVLALLVFGVAIAFLVIWLGNR